MVVYLKPKDIGLSVQVDDDTVWLVFKAKTGHVTLLNVANLADDCCSNTKSGLNQWFNEVAAAARKARAPAA